jgi:hypothetical protein
MQFMKNFEVMRTVTEHLQQDELQFRLKDRWFSVVCKDLFVEQSNKAAGRSDIPFCQWLRQGSKRPQSGGCDKIRGITRGQVSLQAFILMMSMVIPIIEQPGRVELYPWSCLRSE